MEINFGAVESAVSGLILNAFPFVPARESAHQSFFPHSASLPMAFSGLVDTSTWYLNPNMLYT
jgi:hypothetical protein